VKRYGGIQEVRHAWNIAHKYHPIIEEDGLRTGNPRYRLLSPDSFTRKILTGEATDFMNKRKADQLQFMIEYSRKRNKELIQYLREKCRYKGLIIPWLLVTGCGAIIAISWGKQKLRVFATIVCFTSIHDL